MSYLDGVFVDASTGKAVNGATVKLWQSAAFSSPPQKNTALPNGSFQVGSAVTTGTSHGSDGSYRFNAIADGDYWVSIEYNGNIGWEYAQTWSTQQSHSTDVNAHASRFEDATKRMFVFNVPGELFVGTNVAPLLHLDAADYVFDEVRIAVKTAPQGASIIVDVNLGGTTIFTTQANRPTIAAAATAGTSGAPDVTTGALNSSITIDIDQVGSTTKGSDLSVMLRCHRT